MADYLSRGRIMAGFARGVPREYKVYDVPMADLRARFDEALEVILKAWTEDVFSHQGKFWKYKDIAIWPRPFQGRIRRCGSRSPARRRRSSARQRAISAPRSITPIAAWSGHDRVFRQEADRERPPHRPNQICMMTEAWVADSAAKAVDEYAPYFLYFNKVLWHHGGNPPGQKANPGRPAM